MPRILVCLVSGLISLLPTIAAAQAPEAVRIREAITRGYAAIQTAQKVSRKSQACAATCHLQIYGAFSYRAVRGLRIAVDEGVAGADLDRAFRRAVTDFDAAVSDNSLGEVGINQNFFLVAAHEIGLPSTVATSAIARAIALQQTAAGSWPAFYTRPPSSHSPFTFTAFALRSLQLLRSPQPEGGYDRSSGARKSVAAVTHGARHGRPDLLNCLACGGRVPAARCSNRWPEHWRSSSNRTEGGQPLAGLCE